MKQMSLVFIMLLGAALLVSSLLSHFSRPQGTKPFPPLSTVQDLEIRELKNSKKPYKDELASYIRLDPLNPKPYLYLSQKSEQPDLVYSKSLLEFAQKLNPHNKSVIRNLLKIYLTEQAYPDAISQIALLCRLNLREQDRFTDILIKMSTDDEIFQIIRAEVHSFPCWRRSYFRQIVNAKDQLSKAEILVEDAVLHDQFDEAAQKLLTKIISNHLKKGRVAKALGISRESPDVDLAHLKTISSGGPLNKANPTPFGWNSLRSHYGSASFSDSAGMTIRYGGKKIARLAIHNLALSPGKDYLLKTVLNSQTTSPSETNLNWSLACQDSQRLIKKSPLMRRTSHDVSKMRFKIPEEGCNAQKLTLIGRPDRAIGPEKVDILSISISYISEQ